MGGSLRERSKNIEIKMTSIEEKKGTHKLEIKMTSIEEKKGTHKLEIKCIHCPFLVLLIFLSL